MTWKYHHLFQNKDRKKMSQSLRSMIMSGNNYFIGVRRELLRFGESRQTLAKRRDRETNVTTEI